MSEVFSGDVSINRSELGPVVLAAEGSPAATSSIQPVPSLGIRLSGDGREVMIGGNPGDAATARIHLDGKSGDFTVRDASGAEVFRLEARNALIDLGGPGNEGDIRLSNDAGVTTIHLDGGKGDITLLGADCAEEFDVESVEDLEPGTVMTIGHDGSLGRSARAYDTSVAGIVSGAKGRMPGIILNSQGALGNRLPIALSGTVNCLIDARHARIRTGDLLTTADSPGRAMKAADAQRRVGAIVGKALGSIDDGLGMIPVLVTLQ